MKKAGFILTSLTVLGGLLLIESCSKKSNNDPQPVALKADAGPDQTAAPFTKVTLDGSASTGPGTLVYEWSYNGPASESEIQFVDKTQAKPTFTPTKNGAYSFNLRLTSGSQFSEDQVVVTVSGVLTLSGTIDATTLKDVDVNPTSPDYKITGDLVISKTVTVPTNSSIVFDVAEGAGIIIDGGNFTNSNSSLKFSTSGAGWKGFFLKSGTLSFSSLTIIDKAGKGTFDGQTESAALTAAGGILTLTSGVQFTGSQGYDILIGDGLSGGSTVTSTSFSAAKPVKAPISKVSLIGQNIYPANYDYIVLTTPGAGTTVAAAGSAGFTFTNKVKYYIDGDFTAGSVINATSGAQIFMKAGAGILASAGVTLAGSTDSKVVFDGIGGAPWKGLAIGGSNGSSINTASILNAGSDLFSTGSFSSTAKAAIYYFGDANATMINSEIKDSKGYGLYNASANAYVTATSGNVFTNPASSAVSTPVGVMQSTFGSNTTSTFSMPAGVAAVEARVPNSSSSPIGTWAALGGTNYYLMTNNVFMTGAWTLSPGVIIKFKAAKSLNISSGLITAIGTATNPIIFDSEAGTAGTWAGVLIEAPYKFEYCTIKNGGDSYTFKGGITPATEKANLVFNYSGGATNSFKNNTVTGSAGYGVLVELGKQNPDVLNVANANTFNNNVSGSAIVK